MTLEIKPILCREGTMDNYAYVITDKESLTSAIIDASETEPILNFCEKNNITPQYILTTHHHFDHVGANLDLKEKYALQIVGSETEKDIIQGIDIALKDQEEFFLGKTKIKILSAPGHTKGHILFYAENDKSLFTGDVLFNLCIGGLFEGTPEQMFNSLHKIKSLPEDVCFYPGHEYTKHCLAHILKQENDVTKQYVQIALSRLQKGLPVAPISLALEKKCNPYLQINNLKDFMRLF